MRGARGAGYDNAAGKVLHMTTGTPFQEHTHRHWHQGASGTTSVGPRARSRIHTARASDAVRRRHRSYDVVMNAPRKLALTLSAAVASVGLLAGPAIAQDTDPAPAGDDDHRISMADTPRDRLGLILLGALLTAGGVAFVNGRKQLKGERDQASGDFRWR